ncbi:hypothetical protein LCGC14_0712090 [marine sediment metagenome]|uniref:Uncharacterized protein n=1 Tax=marine sediment metagenome TaxID=412755 RepID=A0A0F9QJ95_9ZZZZ
MTNVEPFELIVGPGYVWIGPVGETMPAIDAAVAGSWFDWGNTDGPVTITHGRSENMIRHNQSALPQKEVLVEATETVAFSIAELDLEAYAKALQNAGVTTTVAGGGDAGQKSFAIAPTHSPQFAFLIRVPSGHEDGYMQYEYDRGSMAGNHALAFTRGDKTIIPMELHIFESTGVPGRFGVVRAFTATAV